MSIATQIQRIQGLVDTLRTKIQNKGVTLANDADLEDCVDAIDDIEGGGGTPTPTGYEAEYFTIENTGSSSMNVFGKHGNSSSNNNSSNYYVEVPFIVDYSFDKNTWTTVNATATSTSANITICTIPAGGKVYLRSSSPRIMYKGYNSSVYANFWYIQIAGMGQATISGNIMSLISGDDFIGQKNVASYQFHSMFHSSYGIGDASNLVINTNTSYYSHALMFYNCTYMTSTPSCLPPTTLAQYCYYSMFNGCTGLTSLPSGLLPSTTLGPDCYNSMFRGCTGLTSLPENLLPATIITVARCYQSMFYGCSGITSLQSGLLPATTLGNNCYTSMFASCTGLTSLPSGLLHATTLSSGCYSQMFEYCDGLASVPSNLLSATTLTTSCYYSMFRGCTSLTTAPDLPATTLIDYCYSQMFQNCGRLNYIKALFTTEPGTWYTNNWVSGVASSGTFVKSSSATWTTTGVSGIPSGWTVQTA